MITRNFSIIPNNRDFQNKRIVFKGNTHSSEKIQKPNLKNANKLVKKTADSSTFDDKQVTEIIKEYRFYRNATYSPSDYENMPGYSSDISEVTGKSKAYEEKGTVIAEKQRGFHYRFSGEAAKNIKPGNVISLNVFPSQNLVEELDIFSLKEKNFFYKTPVQHDDWFKMHDPITLYFSEKPTPSQKDKIKKIASPYIRSEKEFLLGKKIDKATNGIAELKYPSSEDEQNLIAEAERVDPTLAKAISSIKEINGGFSAGAFYLLKQKVNSYKKSLNITA